MPCPRCLLLSVTPLLSDFLTLTIDTMQITNSLILALVVAVTAFSNYILCAPAGASSSAAVAANRLREATTAELEDLLTATKYGLTHEQILAEDGNFIGRTRLGRKVYEERRLLTGGTLYFPSPRAHGIVIVGESPRQRRVHTIEPSNDPVPQRRVYTIEPSNNPATARIGGERIGIKVGDKYWVADNVDPNLEIRHTP